MTCNKQQILRGILTGFAAAAMTFLSGCDLESSDDVVRNVGVDYSGNYTQDGAPIVSRNTGENVRSLNLRQNGSNLEAIDNNGIVFRGSIGQVIEGEGSFNLKGRTTAGAEATISGILRADGSTGTMSGTWVEDSLFGSVSATASIRGTVNPDTGNGGDGGTGGGDGGNGGTTSLTLTPSGATAIVSGASQTFTASGGSGSYTWSVGNAGIGTLNRTTGSSVTYTASSTGQQTLSVSDGASTRATTVTQN